MRPRGKVIASILTAVILGYLTICVIAFLLQKSMIYFPSRDILETPRDAGMSYEDIVLVSRDGVQISAWFIPSPKSTATLLFCHGNAGNLSHRIDSIRIFHNMGLDVLIFDYRGYGGSKGSPDEKGTYLDAEAAWNYLVEEKKISRKKIVLFGRSLGSAVAAEIAFRHGGGLLIAESAFTSIPDLGASLYPFLPVRLIARYSYDTLGKVGSIGIPKLFIHSPEDEIIPYDHGLSLFEHASEPKKFLRIRGGHNEGFLISEGSYINGIKEFIEEFLKGSSPS